MRSLSRGMSGSGLGPQDRQRLWTVGRELLQNAHTADERLEGARLITRAMALPAGVDLDESLCRRAGIPLEWLEELREPARSAA